VHHHLIKKGRRGAVGLVVETGDAWEVHHFACLLAFGATAINPYLALSTIETLKIMAVNWKPALISNTA
jgi:glutamate synthase (NADPH/NADH) large chain